MHTVKTITVPEVLLEQGIAAVRCAIALDGMTDGVGRRVRVDALELGRRLDVSDRQARNNVADLKAAGLVLHVGNEWVLRWPSTVPGTTTFADPMTDAIPTAPWESTNV